MVTGVQCGSPAMRHEQFCYFHQRMLRSVKTPPNVRIHPIALIENEEAIQASLMEVINALDRNHIDLRRADLVLKALYIAVKDSRRARFTGNDNQMVREVPDYPAPVLAAPSVSVNVLAVGAAAGVSVTGVGMSGAGVNVARVTEGEDAAKATATVPAKDWFAEFEEAEFRQEEFKEEDKAVVDPTQRKPPARAALPAERKIKLKKKG
jgi:hypothetical protein